MVKAVTSVIPIGHLMELPNAVEADLVQNLLHLEKMLYGYTFKLPVYIKHHIYSFQLYKGKHKNNKLLFQVDQEGTSNTCF
jgi:hypothetical protein